MPFVISLWIYVLLDRPLKAIYESEVSERNKRFNKKANWQLRQGILSRFSFSHSDISVNTTCTFGPYQKCPDEETKYIRTIMFFLPNLYRYLREGIVQAMWPLFISLTLLVGHGMVINQGVVHSQRKVNEITHPSLQSPEI